MKTLLATGMSDAVSMGEAEKNEENPFIKDLTPQSPSSVNIHRSHHENR